MPRLAGWTLLLLVAACAEQPARIAVGRSDTVVINNIRPTRLHARVLDADGRELRSPATRFHLTSGAHVRLADDGIVTCLAADDAEARISAGGVATRIVLRCRPVRFLRQSPGIRLLLGAPPEILTLEARAEDRRPVTLLAGRTAVRDTQIAMLRDGRVSPLTRGQTAIDVELGDCAMDVAVTVIERVARADSLEPAQEFATPLRMVGGEVHSWRVRPGRYSLTLVADTTRQDRLTLGATSMNCAPIPASGQSYSCVARPGAAVVVRHPRAIGRGRPLSGTLFVERMPEPARTTNVRQASLGAARRDTHGSSPSKTCLISLQ